MLKAYEYRLLPTAAQKEQLAQHFGCARYVYNWVLNQRQAHYEETGKTLAKRALQDKLVREEKKRLPWLKEVNSQSLLAAMGHAVNAYSRFFSGQAKFPRFKSRKNHLQKYQCPQHVKVNFEDQKVQLPIIGWVRAKIHRGFVGLIKTCTIKKLPHGTYEISMLVDNHQPLPKPAKIDPEKAVGMDLGITHFAITSQGKKKDNPRFLNRSLPGIKQFGRMLSRKKKGGSNREKLRHRLAKRHYRVARQRNNYHHEIANELLSDNQAETIAFEDLHIKGMVRNKKLSRHILDVGWRSFVSKVSYKAEWSGKNVIYCDRFAPSSKQCPCGYKHKTLSLKDREWSCPECKTHHDRDILAANNILRFALQEITDAAGSAVCVKQFPCGNRSGKPATAKDHSNDAVMGHKKLTLEQLAV